MKSGWIGVDLDCTLAHYLPGRFDPTHVGDPIVPMLNRVKNWIANGWTVKIFTARVADDPEGIARQAIEEWCELHIGQKLEVTNAKDYEMRMLWDDRAIRVVGNEGVPCPSCSYDYTDGVF